MARHRLVCKNISCPAYEHVASATADEVLHCDCGARMEIAIGAPAVIWTGSIGKRYRDKSVDGYHDPDGVRAYTRNTPDGKPKLVEISDWSSMKTFCKENGVEDPRSQPRNLTVSEDGKSSCSPRGMPGQEV